MQIQTIGIPTPFLTCPREGSVVHREQLIGQEGRLATPFPFPGVPSPEPPSPSRTPLEWPVPTRLPQLLLIDIGHTWLPLCIGPTIWWNASWFLLNGLPFNNRIRPEKTNIVLYLLSTTLGSWFRYCSYPSQTIRWLPFLGTYEGAQGLTDRSTLHCQGLEWSKVGQVKGTSATVSILNLHSLIIIF